MNTRFVISLCSVSYLFIELLFIDLLLLVGWELGSGGDFLGRGGVYLNFGSLVVGGRSGFQIFWGLRNHWFLVESDPIPLFLKQNISFYKKFELSTILLLLLLIIWPMGLNFSVDLDPFLRCSAPPNPTSACLAPSLHSTPLP